MDENKKSTDLDQYYTKSNVSEKCIKTLKSFFNNEFWENKTFLEPSAGTGSFLNALHKNFNNVSVEAFDIDPKAQDIVKKDFLTLEIDKKHLITIGNPPFGKRSATAIKFFNHAAKVSDIIAFIVPIQFEKYNVQKKLNSDFKLIYSKILDDNSFIHKDKDYNVRCCFQIWTRLNTNNPDLRIYTPPRTTHAKFEMFLYNNTPETLKYFDKSIYKWNFAVPRQGYYDYSLRIDDEKALQKNVQYIFFKSDDKEVLDNLRRIDFEKLSQKNTTIPGFGKADIVSYYEEVFENE